MTSDEDIIQWWQEHSHELPEYLTFDDFVDLFGSEERAEVAYTEYIEEIEMEYIEEELEDFL